MGLINLFQKKDTGENKPTAADYVEWLLQYMLQTSQTEITIDTNHPLPGTDRSGNNPPPYLPDAHTVINRLKILSKVNPIWKEGVNNEGNFEKPSKYHTINVSTRFKDNINQSTCHIKLRIRCKSA